MLMPSRGSTCCKAYPAGRAELPTNAALAGWNAQAKEAYLFAVESHALGGTSLTLSTLWLCCPGLRHLCALRERSN